MTPYIHHIIEDEILLIEQEDWRTFFTLWYTDYAALSKSSDMEHLKEFFKICSTAGIPAEEHSYDARKDVIRIAMSQIINDLFSEDPDLERVSMVRVINELNSRLYFSLTELIPLYKEAVDATGYKLGEDSLTIVRR